MYLNWASLTSRKYKICLIKCLLFRIWNICTSYDLIHNELEKLKSILVKNGYPIKVINKEIKLFLSKKLIQQEQKLLDDKRKIYLLLPYIGKAGEDIKKKIEELVNQFYPQVNIRVMFKTPLTIGMLFPFKDKTPFLLRSNIVYRISCKTCNAFYIGKTNRCLGIRLDEHKKSKESSVHLHQEQSGHEIDWDSIRIIDKADKELKLLLKEMLHINKQKPNLNVQKKSYVFSMMIGKNDNIS